MEWEGGTFLLSPANSTGGLSISTGLSRFCEIGSLWISNNGGNPIHNINANVGIGLSSTTVTSSRLHVKGSGNTSTSNVLLTQNSNDSDLLIIRNDGSLRFGSQNVFLMPTGNGTSVSLAGRGLLLQTNVGTAGDIGSFSVVGTANPSSGVSWGIRNSTTFQPTTGTSTYTSLLFADTINQTGGANGITRGIHINPTLTSASNWRSIEWSNNTGYGLYGEGTSPNYLNGNLSVGVITPTARLHVRGSGTTSGSTTLRIENSGQTPSLVVRDDGNVGIGTATPTSRLLVSGTTSVLSVVGSGTTLPLFTVQGSQGELFSVTDSLTGSLFSVNDISGLPILEVFSDNTILSGNYLAPSLNTTVRMSATTGTTNIYSIPITAYTGSFFDYTVSDGTNLRAGNIMSVWSGTSVNFTEVTTTDFGNTSGITFNMVVSSGNAILRTSGTTTGWTVKTIVRAI
jgi:hypothetical protein